MKQTYSSLGEPAVYSTTRQPKLCKGDVIWVVEGDDSQPMQFRIVDCFTLSHCDDVPRHGPFFSTFKLKCVGAKSLLTRPVELSKESMPWFRELHERFLTKQRFFDRLGPAIVAGLVGTAAISL
jgi:hypothetical protein